MYGTVEASVSVVTTTPTTTGSEPLNDLLTHLQTRHCVLTVLCHKSISSSCTAAAAAAAAALFVTSSSSVITSLSSSSSSSSSVHCLSLLLVLLVLLVVLCLCVLMRSRTKSPGGFHSTICSDGFLLSHTPSNRGLLLKCCVVKYQADNVH